MDVVDADDDVIGEAPAPIAVVTDNGPCAAYLAVEHCG
jgi:putative transposase